MNAERVCYAVQRKNNLLAEDDIDDQDFITEPFKRSTTPSPFTPF
jgi:hypothetical protein